MFLMNEQSHTNPGGDAPRRSRAARIAWLLDNQFQIPGTSVRVGIDGLVGLIPGIGDTITTCLSLLILAEAIQLRVRKRTLAIMIGNIALDWIVGLVPLLGDAFDILYKANMRNLAILEADLAARDRPHDSVAATGGPRRVENIARSPRPAHPSL